MNTNQIWIADDDADDREIYQEVLNRIGARTPIFFWNGKEVLNALFAPDAVPPGLLLLDGHMPMIDGWQVIETIRAQKAFPSMQIVLLTGSIPGAERSRMEQWGVRVVTKPTLVSEAELLFRELTADNRNG